MTRIILFLLVILVNQVTIAQKKDSKYFIGLSYGKSLPLGDFKDNKVQLDNLGYSSGFANTGVKFDVFGGYSLNKEYGVTGLIRFQSFSTDANSFAKELNRLSPSVNYEVDSKDWKFASVLGGVYYNFPLTNRMSLQPKCMIGLMYGISPEINVNANDGSNTRVIFVESGNSIGLAYEFGIGLKSKLGNNFALMPTFDFSGAFLSFKNNKTVTNYNGSNLYNTRTYNPSILTFNFGLSLAYIF